MVDTSVVFPHKLGPPYKRALRTLMAEILQKIIQNDGNLNLSLHVFGYSKCWIEKENGLFKKHSLHTFFTSRNFINKICNVQWLVH